MKKIIVMLLLLSMALLLCACGSSDTESTEQNESSSVVSNAESEASEAQESEEASAEENTETFKVKVIDADGNPVSGVMVQLCKDSCIPAKTGDDGIASFNAEITDGYKLSVLMTPEGYVYEGEAEIYLESGITEYTIELSAGSEL